eukprot:gene4929-5160_t
MPPAAFVRYARQAQDVAAAYFAPPPPGALPDWTVDIWNWGVPEGEGGKWSEMVRTYAAAAPAVGAFTQQSINENATTVCLNATPATFAPRAGARAR